MPIGIFDSGVGGLSVVRHIQAQLPHEDLIYVADQAHVPYGSRPAQAIRQFSAGITQFLIEQGCPLVVVACNTATGIALNQLRQRFPHLPFVGMEPAVKPAAEQTRNGKVGILATPGTFRSRRYATLLDRFAQNVLVWEDPCLGLVEKIEAGELDTSETEALLTNVLEPMIAQGVDTIVLGCTHYPFVLTVIRRVLAKTAVSSITLIDPAPAVAQQTERLLTQHQLAAQTQHAGKLQLVTTGQAEQLARLAGVMVPAAEEVKTAVWLADGHLIWGDDGSAENGRFAL